jgi:nicotinamidase/pyrazinamidase
MSAILKPRAGDVLVIVDVQKDFLPGGALAVPQGDEVVPVLNRYLALFEGSGLPIFATRDWHPANHCSFKAQSGPWPQHCVVGSEGARFAPGLKLPSGTVIVSKPSVADRETYSAFEGTDFDERLHAMKVRRLFVGGLATDYCVLNTVLGALQRGFEVILLRDAIRAVNAQPGDGVRAEQAMAQAGAKPAGVDELIG